MSGKSALLIGLGGGTGSGKTLVAKNLLEGIDSSSVAIIEQDSYYHDLKDIPKSERDERNFDHPDAFDWPLLRQQVSRLIRGHPVDIPVYDYTTHTRSGHTRHIADKSIVLVEGILVLADPELRDLMDIKAYVDTDNDIRFIRRLQRDINERGRSLESVIRQYQESVRPMHMQFVEPTKRFADIIIPEGGYNTVAIDLLQTKIESLLYQIEEENRGTS